MNPKKSCHYNVITFCIDSVMTFKVCWNYRREFKTVNNLEEIENYAPNLQIRIKRPQRNLIERAARTKDMDVSSFVRDSAVREAQNVLLDRRLFQLGNEDWDTFNTILDAPPENNPKLRSLLGRTPLWEN